MGAGGWRAVHLENITALNLHPSGVVKFSYRTVPTLPRPMLLPSSIPQLGIVSQNKQEIPFKKWKYKDDLCCPPLQFPNCELWANIKEKFPLKKRNTKTTLLSPFSILFAARGMLQGILRHVRL
jgi:hypothetical protein